MTQKLTIRCEVDGNAIATYEFDTTYVSKPQKLAGGPITIYFDPDGDVHHQLEITSLPPNQSKTIAGGDATTSSS